VVKSGIVMRQDNGYRTYSEGTNKNVFLKGIDKKDFQGIDSSYEAAFPDFFHPNTSAWWENEISQFYKSKVQFDGLWLDRNGPSNACDGPCVEK
jgi:alpha-glucosidase